MSDPKCIQCGGNVTIEMEEVKIRRFKQLKNGIWKPLQRFIKDTDWDAHCICSECYAMNEDCGWIPYRIDVDKWLYQLEEVKEDRIKDANEL